uniref:Uncharacterized protein n=1 Tax=Anopheles stephensi TaxID=30069 RepID=A0A182XYU3_ANOST
MDITVLQFVSACAILLTVPGNGLSFVMRVTDDMDQKFFAEQAANKRDLQIWRSESRRLVVTSDNPLQSLTFMEAPNLDELELFPNSHLQLLILRFCPLDGLWRLPTKRSSSPLEVLNLCSNAIEFFSLDVLRTFPNLKDLLLQRNRIARITGSASLPALGTLHAKQNHLTELNLAGCNCSALLFVYASQNMLSNFPQLGDSLTALEVLDLNGNQLTTFNATELRKQPNLKTLLMSKNALKSFNVEDDAEPTLELPLLRVLELHHNQIEVLDLRGWQLPALQTLLVSVNPLVALPDDLLERFPKLHKFSCFCADIDCEWIQRHVQHVRSGRFELSVAWQGPKELSEGYRCVTVPYVGCVRCPFKRKLSTTTERLADG